MYHTLKSMEYWLRYTMFHSKADQRNLPAPVLWSFTCDVLRNTCRKLCNAKRMLLNAWHAYIALTTLGVGIIFYPSKVYSGMMVQSSLRVLNPKSEAVSYNTNNYYDAGVKKSSRLLICRKTFLSLEIDFEVWLYKLRRSY